MTFWWIAAATLASEDLACLSAGVLVARGDISFAEGVAACALGIFAGDLGLYGAGRSSGVLLRRFRVSDAKMAQARRWLESRGRAAVFLSRFTPGLRVPTYLAAGLLRLPFATFAGTLFAAVALWSVLIVGAVALLGHAPAWWSVAAPVAGLTLLQSRVSWKRWEFWPAWAAYLPLAPYFLWLAIRYRSVTLFTLANPGILTGGLAGESKSGILSHLRRGAPAYVPRFRRVDSVADVEESFRYPVVLKPDVGERGQGVLIARDRAEAARYLAAAARPVIAQRFIEGPEFGLLYDRGELVSITAKQFPHVTGDGERTVEQLIQADSRAAQLAEVYRGGGRVDFGYVPGAGERVSLVEIGSHCRGTVFLDGRSLWTPELEQAVARVAAAHPGFELGRFDVRAESTEALQRGEFQVLELNGVGAEPAHIYDPRVSLLDAYRALMRHWQAAFAIGAKNRAQGMRPMSLFELAKVLRARG